MSKVFLNGYIEEEVYVRQPLGFQSSKFSNTVFKLQKALYSLKQAPRSYYERLKSFLLTKGSKKGSVDKTFFSSSMAMIPYWFRYTWMTSYLVILLMLLFPNFQIL
jgi:hypothetical protein